jgi:hypothetical protein
MAIVASRVLRRVIVGVMLVGTAVACSGRDDPKRGASPAKVREPGNRSEAPPPTIEDARSSPDERPPATARDPSDRGSKRVDTAGDVGPQPSPYHLDDTDVEYEPTRREARARRGRPIELVLRSSPPGAMAAVDGVTVGPTPTFWEGVADGRPREFTFVLPGHTVARYRFVATHSGVVHGTLDRLKEEEGDAGPDKTEASARAR